MNDEVIEVKYPMGALPENTDDDEDFLAGVEACVLQDDGTCEACQ